MPLHLHATSLRLASAAPDLGHDALAFLHALPLERVALVHIGGGKRVRGPAGAERILDDHRHAVPAPVFALLEELAARGPGDLDGCRRAARRGQPGVRALAPLKPPCAADDSGQCCRPSAARSGERLGGHGTQ